MLLAASVGVCASECPARSTVVAALTGWINFRAMEWIRFGAVLTLEIHDHGVAAAVGKLERRERREAGIQVEDMDQAVVPVGAV
jgi:hypothetical protein